MINVGVTPVPMPEGDETIVFTPAVTEIRISTAGVTILDPKFIFKCDYKGGHSIETPRSLASDDISNNVGGLRDVESVVQE